MTINSFTTMDSGGNKTLPPHRFSTGRIDTTPPTHIITMVCRLPPYGVDVDGSPRFDTWTALRRDWPRALSRGFERIDKLSIYLIYLHYHSYFL